MSFRDIGDFSKLPPPGSGDLTVVSDREHDIGEFTLSGWRPKRGVHLPGRSGPQPPLAFIYLGCAMVFSGLASWLMASSWVSPVDWAFVAVFGALALGVQYFEIEVSHASVSLGVGFLIAACLMAGPAAGALTSAIVLGLWSASREILPWFEHTRASTPGVRWTRPFWVAASSGMVFVLSSLTAFEVFGLEAPVARVTSETIGAAVVLTVLVYLLSNLSSLLINALAGDDIRAHLKTAIPAPALVEFLALPAALLLVVTLVRLGNLAFVLLAWLYLMAAFLGWRSWQDRRQVAARLDEVEMLRKFGASLVETLEMGDLVLRFRDAVLGLVSFEQMILILSDATEEISQTYSFDRFGARGEVTQELLRETRERDPGMVRSQQGATLIRDFGAGEAAMLRLRLDFMAPKIPSQRSLMILETICQQGGTALSNGYLFRLANTDPLTGVASRRYFERALRSTAGRERVFAIIMLDLDRFKRINDEYGHAVGDEVLRDLAEVLRGSLRAMDIAGRYGGEEFVVLLPGAQSPEATAVAERIRRTLEQRRLTGNERELGYTASFGVADSSRLEAPEDAMDVMWHADEALLAAKRSGRNQVVTFSSLLDA